jgi:hypothetical protein
MEVEKRGKCLRIVVTAEEIESKILRIASLIWRMEDGTFVLLTCDDPAGLFYARDGRETCEACPGPRMGSEGRVVPDNIEVIRERAKLIGSIMMENDVDPDEVTYQALVELAQAMAHVGRFVVYRSVKEDDHA